MLTTLNKDFKNNNNLSMCFYWESIHKQIRIVGKGSIVNDEISDKYFGSRPRGSQIGAWASDQSSLIKSFSQLKHVSNGRKLLLSALNFSVFKSKQFF